jgi:hypothetical protein
MDRLHWVTLILRENEQDLDPTQPLHGAGCCFVIELGWPARYDSREDKA